MLDSRVHILVDHLTFEEVGGGVWGWKVLVMARAFFPNEKQGRYMYIKLCRYTNRAC